MRHLIACALLGMLVAVLSATAAVAQPIKIVAFGGSSTYGQGLERLAQKYDAGYTTFIFPGGNDAKYRIANDPQLRTTGVAHYNAAGYDMIVAKILPEVEALIARVRR